MEKRLVLAIALSILVILIFQSLAPQPKRTVHRVSEPAATNVSVPAAAPAQKRVMPHKFQEKETLAETAKYKITFSNAGGSVKSIVLKRYNQELVSGAKGEMGVLSLKSNILAEGLESREFKLVRKDKNKVVYAFSVPGKFNIQKEYRLHNSNDYIELYVLIENTGSGVIYKDYDLLGASSFRPKSSVMGRRFMEVDSMVDGKIVRNTRIKNNEDFIRGIVSWTGVKSRYFSIILRPYQDSEGVIIKQFGPRNLASGIRSKRVPIYQGASVQDRYILYVGPNDIATLKKLGLGLEQIVNYGFFGGITKILLVILRSFHKITGNWGLAIIMMTFLINLVLFPLTKKSFQSMRKMQEIQPHIEKLRKVHKDNPQRLNKELAELYRQYNINPFGGCLPLLLQMPIFIALYQGLIRSIELKGANFLWIKDLSLPDAISIPFKLPLLGNEIHILPLLMVIAMFYQQFISTRTASSSASKEQQQQQKFMLVFFPLFFGFLFYNFPSGLVLYWLTNTVLMTIEHTFIRRGIHT